MAWLTAHNFLVLALLFLPPGLLVIALRRDLRPVVTRMSLCAMPFATTEFLFYPEYWEPKFLFDLVEWIGFGIEDVIFVVGLVAFSSTGYAFVFRRRYSMSRPGALRRASSLLLGVLALVVTFALIGVPMIYGSIGIMIGVALLVGARRRDLVVPTLLGGVVSLAVYTGLCWVYAALLPQVFELTWKTDKFLGVFVAGVPVEELLYGFACGLGATAFYPFVWGSKLYRGLAPGRVR